MNILEQSQMVVVFILLVVFSNFDHEYICDINSFILFVNILGQSQIAERG